MSSTSEQVLPLTALVRLVDAGYNNTVQTTVAALFYGIYLTIFMHSSKVLYPKIRSSERKASRILFGITSVLCVSTTLWFAGRLSAYLLQSSWPRRTDPALSIPERFEASIVLMAVPNKIYTFAQLLNFILGDAIVLWRSYVICAGSPWRQAILVVLFLCNTALGLGIIIFAMYIPGACVLQAEESTCKTISKLEGAYSFVSFGVNFIATAFIAMTARRMIQTFRNADMRSKGSPVLGILFLLTEGGMFFCILQLLFASFVFSENESNYPTDSFSLAAPVFAIFTIFYAAMYPSLVVILIEKQRSLIDMTVVLHRTNEASPSSDMEKNHREGDGAGQISTIHFAIGSGNESESGGNVEGVIAGK